MPFQIELEANQKGLTMPNDFIQLAKALHQNGKNTEK
jgi:hypothetical protein